MSNSPIELPEKIELPDCISNAVSNLTEKPTQTIGKVINDILYLATSKISFHADKIRIKYAADIEKFKKSIECKVNQIPENDLAQPDIQLIGTAIDDSKYCLEHEELREMFANLIAASLNETKNDKATPFCSMIIKRLTPFDALILSTFSGRHTRPICQYDAKDADSLITIQTNVYLEGISKANKSDIEKRAIAISELEALGLVKTNYAEQLLTESLYEPFTRVEAYNEYVAIIENKGGDRKMRVTRGYVALTPTGMQFMDVCMPSQA